MFKKTIAVLLVFSIALSSCGKKDKSNDFFRTAPVDPSPPIETSDSPDSPTSAPSKTNTPTTCDGFAPCVWVRDTCDGLAPCRFVRDHWQYEMINVFDVAITPNRVFWAFVISGSMYTVYKMPIFRWMRKKPKVGVDSEIILRSSDYDNISDWLDCKLHTFPPRLRPPRLRRLPEEEVKQFRDVGSNTLKTREPPTPSLLPKASSYPAPAAYNKEESPKSKPIETRSIRLGVCPSMIPDHDYEFDDIYAATESYYNEISFEYTTSTARVLVDYPRSPSPVLGNEEKLESIENMNKKL